jgi:hypothetical protein
MPTDEQAPSLRAAQSRMEGGTVIMTSQSQSFKAIYCRICGEEIREWFVLQTGRVPIHNCEIRRLAQLAAEPKAVQHDFCQLRQEQDPGGGTIAGMNERLLAKAKEYILNPENAEKIRKMIEEAQKQQQQREEENRHE